MTARQELEQAIAVLESHRDILEIDVVDTAVAALRDRLLTLNTEIPHDLQQNSVVLTADLSGFTAMSELMDAEEVRDTINAVWQKLDTVVTAWGGQIDQHIGDGVNALFPVSSDLANAAERATLAALDMQLELELFYQDKTRQGATSPLKSTRSEFNLRMRIGIHTGPVIFGKVGSSIQYTAVGDTVSIANQLEQAAPIGGILISEAVFNHIQHNFVTKPAASLLLDDVNRHMPVYVVHNPKRFIFQDVDREVLPHETRFIGRNESLERLQFGLETTVESSSAQVMAIIAEAGVGKSRLRMEFEKLLALQPVPIRLFKGGAKRRTTHAPYGAIRRLFENFFDIDQRSSPQAARAKLVDGICSILADDDVHARERAHFMGHLLGFDFADSAYLKNFKHGPRRIREYAFQDVALFFTAVTAEAPVVLLLENMDAADEGSIALLDYLAQACAERPLFIICLARPTLLTQWPACQLYLSNQAQTHTQLNLSPLTSIDSRHLIASQLQNIPRPPIRLIDLLAEAAAGNPFLISELIESLSMIGAIIKGSKQWRVQLGHLNELRGQLTLAWLLQKQLQQLLPLEQAILQKAAVIGESFGDTAVTDLVCADDSLISRQQVRATLRSLEQQGLIKPRITTSLPNSREYNFRHEPLRKAAYAATPETQRQNAHAQFADWLGTYHNPLPPEMLVVIASHLEQANNKIEAANWYGRAADHARKNFLPETAIHYYQQALNLLPTAAAHISQRLQLSNGLGATLRQQGRFDQAIDVFTEIRAIALEIGDKNAAARAFRSLFIIQNFQGAHLEALAAAEQAEQVARANNAPAELAAALAAKGWAYTYLGDLRQALTCGKQALAVSAKIAAQRETAYGQALIGIIGRILRQHDQAQSAANKALALFREIGDRVWEGLMLRNLGSIAFSQNDYDTAAKQWEQSLRLFQNIDDGFGAMLCLRDMGQLAQAQNDFATAETQLEKALIWAEKSGNAPFRITAAADLGRLHLAQLSHAETVEAQGEHLRQARLWLERGQQLTEQDSVALPRAIIQIEMARLLLAEQTPEKAFTQIRSVVLTAQADDFLKQSVLAQQTCAIAWREMAVISAQLPDELPINIDGQAYDVAASFSQSVQRLTKLGDRAKQENARSIFAWAVYELREGNHQKGESLWQKAREIYTQLGLTQEVAKMERFTL